MYILIVRNNSNAGAMAASRELMAYLAHEGIGYGATDSFDLPRQPQDPVDGEHDANGLYYADAAGDQLVDLVVVLGGDGTVLRAARMVGVSGVPLVGVNFGHLGFLSNPGDDGVVRVVEAALSGDVVREERTNLHIEAGCLPAGAFAAGAPDGAAAGAPTHIASYFALNELAITRGNLGNMVDLRIAVNGDRFMRVRGDGVVLASATGSTAYALSAGGPVVSPASRGLVMVPIAPHSLRSRAAVTAEGDAVSIALASDDGTRAASCFVDGVPLPGPTGANLFTVRAGARPTTLLRYRYAGFYSNAAKAFL